MLYSYHGQQFSRTDKPRYDVKELKNNNSVAETQRKYNDLSKFVFVEFYLKKGDFSPQFRLMELEARTFCISNDKDGRDLILAYMRSTNYKLVNDNFYPVHPDERLIWN